MERRSQRGSAVGLGEREAIRLRELGELVGRIMQLRIVIVAVVGLLLVGLIAIDPSSVTSLMFFAILIALIGVAVFDYRRIGRYDVRFVPLDLGIVVAIQTTAICLTGGAESPILFVLVLVSHVAGVALGARKESVALVVLISASLWMIALLGFDGRLPKTVPDLLHLGPGFVERRLYVVAKVAVINAILLGAFIVGTLMHRTINRMLDTAIGARENALDMLTTRNRELLELSSAIAHELKNPLASIQGLVQLLARGGTNSQERIAVLEREVARMRDTLDELLNFSRPLGDLSKKPVPLSPLIEELTRIHEGLTHAKGITVVLPAKNPGTIVADPRKLGQALVNLFQNAIEAVAAGGRIQWIAVERSGWLELGVEDDGPGIDPALKDRIGRQSGDTTKPAGSGIGLAVARAIAEQHGGTLSIEDRAGGGVVALLRIPTGGAAEAA